MRKLSKEEYEELIVDMGIATTDHIKGNPLLIRLGYEHYLNKRSDLTPPPKKENKPERKRGR